MFERVRVEALLRKRCALQIGGVLLPSQEEGMELIISGVVQVLPEFLLHIEVACVTLAHQSLASTLVAYGGGV